MPEESLSAFLKYQRKQANLTQQQLAAKAGVGLRFIREIEQGKTTLKLDKINYVLSMFGHEMKPVALHRTIGKDA